MFGKKFSPPFSIFASILNFGGIEAALSIAWELYERLLSGAIIASDLISHRNQLEEEFHRGTFEVKDFPTQVALFDDARVLSVTSSSSTAATHAGVAKQPKPAPASAEEAGAHADAHEEDEEEEEEEEEDAEEEEEEEQDDEDSAA